MSSHTKWRLSFWPVAAFLLVLPLLVSLGVWQVQRGIQKQAAFDRFDASAQSQPQDATCKSIAALNALPQGTRVLLRGRYVEGHDFLLDNMPRDGTPGHHVLTPFQPEGADYVVVVDRGWRPRRASDTDVVPPATAQEISGMLASWPQPGLRLGDAPDGQGWPRVVLFPQAADLSRMMNRPVAEARLLLDETAAEGFRREWKPAGIPPARHYAYAFQWFALAAALIVVFVVRARARVRPEEKT